MTRHTITTRGNARPWDHTPGYRNASRWGGKLERPEGEPSLLHGAAIVLGVFALGAFVAAVL